MYQIYNQILSVTYKWAISLSFSIFNVKWLHNKTYRQWVSNGWLPPPLRPLPPFRSTNHAVILAKLLIVESSSLDHLSVPELLFNENPSLLGEGFYRKVEKGKV